MVSCTTTCVPLVAHDEPVTAPSPPPPPPSPGSSGMGGALVGTEHSLTALPGAGSRPNVAALQVKLPDRTLNTNVSEAPNATLVDPDTAQVSPTLQIVTYPSGRFFAACATPTEPTTTSPPTMSLPSMMRSSVMALTS